MKNAYHYVIERILPSRISYRLALSYLLILCLFIIVVILSVVQVQDVSRRSQEFASQDLQKLLQPSATTLVTGLQSTNRICNNESSNPNGANGLPNRGGSPTGGRLINTLV